MAELREAGSEGTGRLNGILGRPWSSGSWQHIQGQHGLGFVQGTQTHLACSQQLVPNDAQCVDAALGAYQGALNICCLDPRLQAGGSKHTDRKIFASTAAESFSGINFPVAAVCRESILQ